MKYAQTYTHDQLFDMFANQADFEKLANQDKKQIAADLKDMAPDMEDPGAVTLIIKRMAETLANAW